MTLKAQKVSRDCFKHEELRLRQLSDKIRFVENENFFDKNLFLIELRLQILRQ